MPAFEATVYDVDTGAPSSVCFAYTAVIREPPAHHALNAIVDLVTERSS